MKAIWELRAPNGGIAVVVEETVEAAKKRAYMMTRVDFTRARLLCQVRESMTSRVIAFQKVPHDY